jgi:VanZ family protein
VHAWHPAFSRSVLRDAVVNICIYMPLGFIAHFVFGKIRWPLLGLYGPVLLGLVLSTAVELTQLYTPHRDTSLIDVVTNVIGSALGVAVAVLFEKMAGPLPRRSLRIPIDSPISPGALMLVFCWAAWLLFPFFFRLSQYELHRRLSVFVYSPAFSLVPFVSAVAVWFTLGLLMTAAGIRRSVALLGLSILAIPAQFFIAERQPAPSDLLGAIAGFLLFAPRPRAKPVTKTEAWAFSVLLVLRGLSPFRFVPASAGFTWIPFVATLNADWQPAILVMLGKICYYASAIWLLRASGMRLLRAAATVAAILAGIEIAQIHLPGRTPETTDPLLALVMGFVLLILSRETGRRFRSAE